jgi:hypothetical protein
LLRTRFTSAIVDVKRSLRFGGSKVDKQELALELPRASVISHATLRLVGAMVGNTAAGGPTGVASAPPALTDDAVQASPGVEIASRLTLPSALLPEGGTIDVLASGPTALTLKLYQDSGGQQSSPHSLLAQSRLAIELGGNRQRCRFRFESPPVLGAGSVWVSLTPHDASISWLLTSVTGSAVCRRTSNGAWIPQDAGGRRASATLFASEPAADANATRGVQVYIDGTQLSAIVAAGTDREYAFAAQAQARAQSATTDLVPLEIDIASSERGQLTVSAPRIEYDPAL